MPKELNMPHESDRTEEARQTLQTEAKKKWEPGRDATKQGSPPFIEKYLKTLASRAIKPTSELSDVHSELLKKSLEGLLKKSLESASKQVLEEVLEEVSNVRLELLKKVSNVHSKLLEEIKNNKSLKNSLKERKEENNISQKAYNIVGMYQSVNRELNTRSETAWKKIEDNPTNKENLLTCRTIAAALEDKVSLSILINIEAALDMIDKIRVHAHQLDKPSSSGQDQDDQQGLRMELDDPSTQHPQASSDSQPRLPDAPSLSKDSSSSGSDSTSKDIPSSQDPDGSHHPQMTHGPSEIAKGKRRRESSSSEDMDDGHSSDTDYSSPAKGNKQTKRPKKDTSDTIDTLNPNIADLLAAQKAAQKRQRNIGTSYTSIRGDRMDYGDLALLENRHQPGDLSDLSDLTELSENSDSEDMDDGHSSDTDYSSPAKGNKQTKRPKKDTSDTIDTLNPNIANLENRHQPGDLSDLSDLTELSENSDEGTQSDPENITEEALRKRTKRAIIRRRGTLEETVELGKDEPENSKKKIKADKAQKKLEKLNKARDTDEEAEAIEYKPRGEYNEKALEKRRIKTAIRRQRSRLEETIELGKDEPENSKKKIKADKAQKKLEKLNKARDTDEEAEAIEYKPRVKGVKKLSREERIKSVISSRKHIWRKIAELGKDAPENSEEKRKAIEAQSKLERLNKAKDIEEEADAIEYQSYHEDDDDDEKAQKKEGTRSAVTRQRLTWKKAVELGKDAPENSEEKRKAIEAQDNLERLNKAKDIEEKLDIIGYKSRGKGNKKATQRKRSDLN